MNSKKYNVTCLKCKKTNEVVITEVRANEFAIDLNNYHKRHPENVAIISGRYRGDMQFGWECMCGNDSRVARDEFQDISKLVINGSKQAIEKITNSLKITDSKKFKMVEA